jgi:hypothetical protein
MVGLHAYPKPGKDHPVHPADIKDGRLTLECPRCHSTRTIPWRAGPEEKGISPPPRGLPSGPL